MKITKADQEMCQHIVGHVFRPHAMKHDDILVGPRICGLIMGALLAVASADQEEGLTREKDGPNIAPPPGDLMTAFNTAMQAVMQNNLEDADEDDTEGTDAKKSA